jgi:hypothetical protein
MFISGAENNYMYYTRALNSTLLCNKLLLALTKKIAIEIVYNGIRPIWVI